MLINRFLPKQRSLLWRFDKLINHETENAAVDEQRKAVISKIQQKFQCSETELFNGILNGFNQATLSGPLCEEEIQGTAFLIQSIQLEKEDEVSVNEEDTYGPFGGQVISTVKDLCKRALLNAEPRLMEGVYLCNLLATPENYGIVYGLINKCRGRVVSEEC